MKIGILNADTVELPGASKFGQYPEMFAKIAGQAKEQLAA